MNFTTPHTVNKYYLLFFLTFMLSFSGRSQNKADQELGAWYILSSSNQIAEKWDLTAEVQFRYFELASQLQQFKARVGIKYRFTNQWSARIGYAYFETDPSYLNDQPEDIPEHRIYEDLYLNNKIGKLAIAHRYRAEHRFFNTANSETLHWMRYMITVSYPLSDQWTIDAFDEVFINLQEPLFGQNWLGLGVSHHFSKKIKARLGYFKIHLDGPDFERIQLGVYFKTDLRKKAASQ